MEEIEKLLGMDLPEDAKELLSAVNNSHKALTEANKTMVDTIASKENANAELIQARKDLKTELQDVKDSKSKTDDKSVQEKLDALNAEWNDKHQAVINERDAIKTDMLNKTKFDEFGNLNIAKMLPSDFNDIQTKVAMDSIKGLVLNDAEHDESMGWVYKENGVTKLNPSTGKPMTISERFADVKESGALSMFLSAGEVSTGGGTPPNGGSQTVTLDKNMSHADKAKAMSEMGSEAYLQSIKK